MTLPPDFRDLLVLLNSEKVRYMVLGGYAVNLHGHHRNTKDLDVWIAIERENLDRVQAALVKFGFSPRTVAPEAFTGKQDIFTFGTPPMRVDILTKPSGVDFNDCYERRVIRRIDGLEIPLLSIGDLIVNKRASGRARDVADVEELGLLQVHAAKKKRKRRS